MHLNTLFRGILLAGAAFVVLAAVTKLPAEDQKVLREVARFEEIPAATNLPPAIFARCADHNGKLAERGRRWEATDVIENQALPTKRLIWAVRHGDYYVVHYERGGRGHSFHVVVAKLRRREGNPDLFWQGVGGRFKDVQAFLNALAANQLDDWMEYAR